MKKSKTRNGKRAGGSLKRIVGRRYKYMHTLNSMPAHYYPGEQICYAVRTRPIPLCDTLAQIKREQRATVAWRKSEGFDCENKSFGWMKVQSPNID